jgi:sugar phosphate isomerase/epimerase
VTGVQFDAVGDLAPDRLGATARKEIQYLLRSHRLEVTALHCPLRHGLDYPINLQPRIERLNRALELSFDLGARRVIIEAGRVPSEDAARGASTLSEPLRALAAHGDRIGARLLLETGQDSGDTLAKYLTHLSASGLGVNYDPANLLMHGFDPIEGLGPLRSWLAHSHAHDVKKSAASRGAMDVPIGHGDIDWISYIGALAAQEYDGWIVVETDSPDIATIEQGVKFLRRLV